MAVFKLVFCLQCIPAVSSRTSENLGRLQSMFVFFCDMFWNFIDKFGDLWEFLPLFFSLHVINTYCSYANNHTNLSVYITQLIVIFCNLVKLFHLLSAVSHLIFQDLFIFCSNTGLTWNHWGIIVIKPELP